LKVENRTSTIIRECKLDFSPYEKANDLGFSPYEKANDLAQFAKTHLVAVHYAQSMYSSVFFKETGGARPCCDFIKIKGKEPVTRGKRRGGRRGQGILKIIHSVTKLP